MEDGGIAEEQHLRVMSLIRSFRDLDVYQAARDQTKVIYECTRKFPRDERYALTDQIRRSSRAVKAMIAEAWGRRRYKAVFVNKLDEALGEATETQSWLDDCLDAGYITNSEFVAMDVAWQKVGGMLNNMIAKSASFCAPSRSEL